METLVALEVRNRAAQMCADGAGNREALIAIAEYEDLFLYQEGGRAEGKVRRIADLKRLRRLIENVRHQEPYDGSEAYSDC
jgi:hypothetical protein